jgi:hypothetical protein
MCVVSILLGVECIEPPPWEALGGAARDPRGTGRPLVLLHPLPASPARGSLLLQDKFQTVSKTAETRGRRSCHDTPA